MILLLMFIGHYSSITMFYHTHVIDGITYCHSHFYRTSKSAESLKFPQHSKNELKLIQDFNHIIWNADAEIPQVEKPLYTLSTVLLTANATQFPWVEVHYSSLRAPPSFSA